MAQYKLVSARTKFLVVAITAAVAVLSLIAFLVVHSLDEADKWSSVPTLLLTVISGATSVIFSRFPQPEPRDAWRVAPTRKRPG